LYQKALRFVLEPFLVGKMEEIKFELTEEYIELIKLLKVLTLAQTGGHAKMIVDNGEVLRNGEQEFRKRAKLIKGDVLVIADQIQVEIV
jgi:ribosome-associated protein